MKKRSSGAAALFIDSIELLTAASAIELKLDFGNLIEHFRQNSTTVKSIFYTPPEHDIDHPIVLPLIQWMKSKNYYNLRRSEAPLQGENIHRTLAGNMKSEMALDALSFGTTIDHAVFIANMAGSRTLVSAIQQYGTRVSVISSQQGERSFIHDGIRNQADEFIDLLEFLRSIKN